ncbi:hypothetical protein T484DRAFT_1864469 [Baffinella frigidus]|nr:hypothetical protein T484DRAFT_1864469 [Cryptophyta sp. CCMP2293]
MPALSRILLFDSASVFVRSSSPSSFAWISGCNPAPVVPGREASGAPGKLLAFAGLQASLSLVELFYAGRINSSALRAHGYHTSLEALQTATHYLSASLLKRPADAAFSYDQTEAALVSEEHARQSRPTVWLRRPFTSLPAGLFHGRPASV